MYMYVVYFTCVQSRIDPLFAVVISSDNLANSLEPDQVRRFVGPDLDQSCLTL